MGKTTTPQSAFFCNPSLDEVQECVEYSKSKMFEVSGFLHFKMSHNPPPKPYLSLTTASELLLVHQRFQGREGGSRQTARQNKPHFLEAKQWPKSIRKIKRRNIRPRLYLIKVKMMIFGGTSLSQQCCCTWMMLGWGTGNVKSGNKWDKCCLGGTFPYSSPLGKAQNTPSSWHHPPGVPQLVCLVILWQLYKLLLIFFKEEFSQS